MLSTTPPRAKDNIVLESCITSQSRTVLYIAQRRAQYVLYFATYANSQHRKFLCGDLSKMWCVLGISVFKPALFVCITVILTVYLSFEAWPESNKIQEFV